jgi:hypothetical protein
MDDLRQIQKEKHEKVLAQQHKKEYQNKLIVFCLEVWLWTMKPRRVAGETIVRYISNHYYSIFPEPVNLDLDQVNEIPGVFRKRLYFTLENTKQTPKPLTQAEILIQRKALETERRKRADNKRRKDVAAKRSNFFDRKQMFKAAGIQMTPDEAMNKALAESLKDAFPGNPIPTEDTDMDRALAESLNEMPMDIEDDNIDISDYVDNPDNHIAPPITIPVTGNKNDPSDEEVKKLTGDYLSDDIIAARFPAVGKNPEEEDEMMQLAISESLGVKKDTSSDDMISFCIMLDLRIYGPDPYQPIFLDEQVYYLNKNQIEIIKRIWLKINPESGTGSGYHTSIATQKSIACDMDPEYLNQRLDK